MISPHFEFTDPWLLLLILPAFALIMVVFLFGRKGRPRFTVARVLSAVLQSAVAVLCICALSGMQFVYDVETAQNELVILVDRSFTSAQVQSDMDDFVREVLDANDGSCEVAVILYGREPRIALPMGNYTAEEAFRRYKEAADGLDGSATDLASALLAAWDPAARQGVIRHPETAKALILGDGLQTDRDALAAVRGFTQDGVRVDTAFYADPAREDAAIVDVTLPRTLITAGKACTLGVTLYSSRAGTCELTLIDECEGEETRQETTEVSLERGIRALSLPYTFAAAGDHRLTLRLETADDVPENDSFCILCEVGKSCNVLILEKYAGESAQMADVIRENSASSSLLIETLQTENVGTMSATELSKYSEVILYNVSGEDLSDAFEGELSVYAHNLGGGVFTAGGFEKQEGEIVKEPSERDPETSLPVKHSYRGGETSTLASMLPVQVEEYTPAVAVVFVFDISGSMSQITGAPIYQAAEDARDALEMLAPRDYVGVVALEDSYLQVAPLLPMTKRDEIVAAIGELENRTNETTNYAPAFRQAVQMLSTCPDDVAVKHIVLFSDGGDARVADYGPVIRDANAAQGVTITVMTYYKSVRYFDGDPEPYYFSHSYDLKGWEINTKALGTLAAYGEGSLALVPRGAYHALSPYLRADMRLDELEAVGTHSYHPHIGRNSDALGGLTDLELSSLTLDGFFPSRIRAEGAEVVLFAESSPLYAEWAYGEGRVGSLMIDLEGVWSKELLESETGRTLVASLTDHLLRQTEEVAPPGELSFTLTEDNYRTRINVYGFDPAEGDLAVFVEGPDGVFVPCMPEEGALTHNRFVFENVLPGVYTVTVAKVAAGTDLSSAERLSDLPASSVGEVLKGYRTFSYSREFDAEADPYKEGQALLSALSTREAGAQPYEKFVYDANSVFTERGRVQVRLDLKAVFLIAAIVVYLSGIAVRRFRIGRSK